MTDLIFQCTLQDLIKGLRKEKNNASTFISQSIADAKSELRSGDPFIKAEAVRKLTYLQMLGCDISWASFGIVEVMSQPRFAHKRIGFLAGNQVIELSFSSYKIRVLFDIYMCEVHCTLSIYINAIIQYIHIVIYRENRCINVDY